MIWWYQRKMTLTLKAIKYFLQRGAIEDGDEGPFDELGCTPILLTLEGHTAMSKNIAREEVPFPTRVSNLWVLMISC